MAPASAFVGLGGNLGDARTAVLWALAELDRLPGTRMVCSSSLYRSAPVGAGGPDYVNAVAKLETHLAPLDLLDGLQALELQAGRERPYLNAPRTLDLDVLLYADRVLDLPRLKVPHPRMWQRAFVLRPLAEIEPGLVPLGALEVVSCQPITRCEL